MSNNIHLLLWLIGFSVHARTAGTRNQSERTWWRPRSCGSDNNVETGDGSMQRRRAAQSLSSSNAAYRNRFVRALLFIIVACNLINNADNYFINGSILSANWLKWYNGTADTSHRLFRVPVQLNAYHFGTKCSPTRMKAYKYVFTPNNIKYEVLTEMIVRCSTIL